MNFLVVIIAGIINYTLYTFSNRRKKKKQRQILRTRSSPPNSYVDSSSLRLSNIDYQALQNQYRALHHYLALHGYQGLDLPHNYQDISRPNSYEDIYEQLGAYQRLHGLSMRHVYQLLQQYVSQMSSQIYIQQASTQVTDGDPVIPSQYEPNVTFSRSQSGDSGVDENYIPPSMPDMPPPPEPMETGSISRETGPETRSSSEINITDMSILEDSSLYLSPASLPNQTYIHPCNPTHHPPTDPDGNVFLPPRYEFYYPHEFSISGGSAITTLTNTGECDSRHCKEQNVDTAQVSVAARIAQYSANTGKKQQSKKLFKKAEKTSKGNSPNLNFSHALRSNYLHVVSSTSNPNESKYLSLQESPNLSIPSSTQSSGYSSAYASILNLPFTATSANSDEDSDLDHNDVNNDNNHHCDSCFTTHSNDTHKDKINTIPQPGSSNTESVNVNKKKALNYLSTNGNKTVQSGYLHTGIMRIDSGYDEHESGSSDTSGVNNPYLELLPEESTLNPVMIQEQ